MAEGLFRVGEGGVARFVPICRSYESLWTLPCSCEEQMADGLFCVEEGAVAWFAHAQVCRRYGSLWALALQL
jgi:hypothetical protein